MNSQFANNLEEKKNQAISEAANVKTPKEAEEYRIKFLGKEGILKSVAAGIKEVSVEERREAGEMINQFKHLLESTYEGLKSSIGTSPKESINNEKKVLEKQKNEEKKNLGRAREEWIEPKHKREPDYQPGDTFWTIINEKAVECRLSNITIEHTVNYYSITYNGYYSREAVGTVVAGMPDAAPISRKENKIYRTKEMLLASL